MPFADRLTGLRRFYRWFTLSLVQHGFWALFVLLGDGPRMTDPAALPWDWWAFRVAGPVLATMLAAAYLWLRPISGDSSFDTAAASVRALFRRAPAPGPELLRTQLTFALALLPGLLLIARLVQGPGPVAIRIILVGAVEALAFQVINFGVAARSFGGGRSGDHMAVLLFALSWALRDLILAIIGDSAASLSFLMTGGIVTGAAIGAITFGARRLTGYPWTGWAVQFLLVTLVIGFVS